MAGRAIGVEVVNREAKARREFGWNTGAGPPRGQGKKYFRSASRLIASRVMAARYPPHVPRRPSTLAVLDKTAGKISFFRVDRRLLIRSEIMSSAPSSSRRSSRFFNRLGSTCPAIYSPANPRRRREHAKHGGSGKKGNTRRNGGEKTADPEEYPEER